MRITRDTLLKIARDTVDSRTRQDRTIMAVYLSGSLLENDFQLGGTAVLVTCITQNKGCNSVVYTCLLYRCCVISLISVIMCMV